MATVITHDIGEDASDFLYWAYGIQPMTDGAINQGRAK